MASITVTEQVARVVMPHPAVEHLQLAAGVRSVMDKVMQGGCVELTPAAEASLNRLLDQLKPKRVPDAVWEALGLAVGQATDALHPPPSLYTAVVKFIVYAALELDAARVRPFYAGLEIAATAEGASEACL